MLKLAPTPLPSPAAAGRRPRPSSACICCSSVRALEERRPRPGASLREAKRVVLVRHGQSTWNAEGRIQGSSDASVLTPKGEAQAETCRQMLASDSFDACFTSPLARSRRTAEIIWQGRGRGRGDGLIPDPDLREIDLYSFQVSIPLLLFFLWSLFSCLCSAGRLLVCGKLAMPAQFRLLVTSSMRCSPCARGNAL